MTILRFLWRIKHFGPENRPQEVSEERWAAMVKQLDNRGFTQLVQEGNDDYDYD